MGVKEYRFLTRTMKTIGTRSNKLVKAKKRLRDLEEAEPKNPELISLRKRARRLRAERKKEVKRIKTELGHVKEDAARVEKKLEQIPKRHDWGSAESLKKEIEAINEELEATTFFFRLFNSESIKPKRQRMQVLKNREKIVKNEDKGRSMLESQLRTIGNQRHNLEFDFTKWHEGHENNEIIKLENRIRDLVNLRAQQKRSTKKEIKLLEKEIPQLWDSIAHLIPFSTALEKA